MSALNIEFTDEEMAALRAVASREGRSLKVVAHDAVVSVVTTRKHLIPEISARVAEVSAELNDRLA